MQNVIVTDQVCQTVSSSLQTSLGPWNQNVAHILTNLSAHGLFSLFLTLIGSSFDKLIMLGRNHNSVYSLRTFVIAIFDGYLTFRIGTQVGHHFTFAPNGSQLFENHLCQNQRSRHVLLGFRAGITEHDTLVSGALFVSLSPHNSLINIGRLFVNS